MAQNVTIAGNQYPDVPSILVPKTGGGGNSVFADPSVVTAVAADVASGKYFLDSSGVLTQGTASGGSSSWTKVAEKSYQISTTSTTAETVETWATGHSELWTNEKFIYVRVRDTAGKRSGYFYGTDQFFMVYSTSATSTTIAGRFYIRYTNGAYVAVSASSTTGYGVYADYLYPDGGLRIRERYSTSNSLTVNSTYKVEVYLLDPAGGVPIFT